MARLCCCVKPIPSHEEGDSARENLATYNLFTHVKLSNTLVSTYILHRVLALYLTLGARIALNKLILACLALALAYPSPSR